MKRRRRCRQTSSEAELIAEASIHETQFHGESCTPWTSLVAAGGAASDDGGAAADEAASPERGPGAVEAVADGPGVEVADGAGTAAVADLLGAAEAELPGPAPGAWLTALGAEVGDPEVEPVDGDGVVAGALAAGSVLLGVAGAVVGGGFTDGRWVVDRGFVASGWRASEGNLIFQPG
ncbi:hypothetical protein L3i22_024310 [Actinoplanes sp. L3-i22]|nr:hypothetical protein L3i22_024310 [Actinoplanes sp. L3-i22]